MKDFRLDPQLERDCFILGNVGSSLLLLLDNALVPWFILVPRVAVTEVYELEREVQLALLDQVNALSRLLKDELGVDKVNVAAIGNVVRQLHVHVVGRREGDFCWPGVVWGAQGKQGYAAAGVESMRGLVAAALGGDFAPSGGH
jgi:diadenosine tetraphosphate (Ap4A) HIT family hydrolase